MKPEDNKTYKANILMGIGFTLLSFLGMRLFYLQIIKHKTYTDRAQYSTSRIKVKTAPRGIIYDRSGNILATNKQTISLIAYPNKFRTTRNKEKGFKNLTKLISRDKNKIKKQLFKIKHNTPLPVKLLDDLTIEEASLIIENQKLIPGIDIQQSPKRFYPNGSLLSHVIGYISQVNEREIKENPKRKQGDTIGKYGIEKLFDETLRGRDGKKIVEVDRKGNLIDQKYKHAIIDIDPVAGKDIHLTIDSELQAALEKALIDSGTVSTAVAVNPNTGEILALGSYPNYDPNIFTRPISNSTWKNLVIRKAFLNRALLSYVPGSIWKPVTLISALESMTVRPSEKFKVSEAIYLGMTRFGDWTGKEAIYSLEESLAWSRDTSFYQIAQRMSPKTFKEWGVMLGGGRKTGIELLGEESGVVPDEKWKKKYLKRPWYPGNTLHYSIGQSFLLVTPLQAARIYSGIATGGSVPKLHIVKQIDKNKIPNEKAERVKISNSTVSLIKRGLKMCVDSATGQASKLPGISIAGKTGSAEVAGSKKTHSWFASFAPVDKPEIVVIALAEKSGHGGTVAAPIVKRVLASHFNVDLEPKRVLRPPVMVQPAEKPKKKKRFGLF